jgi:tetratricopeptide (TPR) repeat protein
MRTINGKFFLALLIGTTLSGGAVYAVHYFQYERISRALLWQAHHAEEQGDTPRHVEYLQRYLEFRPRDQEEKINLARAWTSDAFSANPRARARAVQFLDEILAQEDRPESRRLLIKTALEIHSLKTARDHLARVLPWEQMEKRLQQARAAQQDDKPLPADLAGPDKDLGELEQFWGQLLELEGQNQMADTIDCYRLAIRHFPEDQTSYTRLAYLLRRIKEPEAKKRQQNLAEADQAIDQMVEAQEGSVNAYLARWRYRRDFDLFAFREPGSESQVALETAAEDVAAAYKRKPDGVEVLLASADLERLRCRAILEDTNYTPEERRQKLNEHRARAQEHLQRGLDLVARQGSGPGNDQHRFHLLWHRANLLLDDLDRARANIETPAPTPEVVARLEADIREGIDLVRKTTVVAAPAAAEYLRGRLLMNERRWAEAATLFERAEKLLAPQPDLSMQANLYLAQCYERLDEHKQMFEAYQRIANQNPNSVQAQLGMAMARWSQGRLDEARAQYQLALSQGKVPARVLLSVARLELQRQALADKPNWKSVEPLVDQAEKANPDAAAEVQLLQVELKVRQDKTAEAEQMLRDALESKPFEPLYYTALVDLSLRKADKAGLAAALEVLEEATERLGDTAPLRLARARYLAQAKGAEAVAEIMALADPDKSWREDDQAQLLSGIADILHRLEREGDARRLWQKMAGLPHYTRNLRLRLLLFDLALKAGDAAGVDQALEDIQSAEQSTGVYYRYGTALKLIAEAKKQKAGGALIRQAREQLDLVAAQRPAWAPVFLARAELSELNGNPKQAIKDLQQAIEHGEASSAVVLRLATLLTEQGFDVQANQVLQQHQKALQANNEFNRIVAVVSSKLNDTNRALEHASRAVRDGNHNAGDLVWFARVLARAGKFAEAEKKLDTAIRLKPADPAAWVAKVQLLAGQRDRKADALEVIDEAKKAIPEAEVPLTLARCYEAVGKLDKAKECYAEVLTKKRQEPAIVRIVANFYLGTGQLKEAEPLLRDLVTGNVKASLTDQMWARRGLAMLLCSGTDYKAFSEAMDLVGLKLDSDGRLVRETVRDENVENRRARARVLASQGQNQFRRQAIEILEGLRHDNALIPEDQYLLALLYNAAGQTEKANSQLEGLVQGPTRTPQYLFQYALNLITHKKLPDDLAKAEKCIGWLEQMEKDRETGPNGFGSVELRARLLEARKKGEEALGVLRKHVAREGAQPEEIVLVVASLSRQGRHKEAFQMCDRLWREGKTRPDVLGGLSVSLMRHLDLTDAQVATVEKHIQTALAKNPDRVALHMHLAAMYDKRGRYDDAEKTYREVLTREPNNIVALNNLAWLLVQRDGDAQEALKYITTAISGIGRRADLLDTRGLVHLALKDNEKAIADLKEAAADAGTPTRLFHLARAYHLNKEKKQAREKLIDAKSAGLEVSALHPIEQAAARELLNRYDLR